MIIITDLRKIDKGMEVVYTIPGTKNKEYGTISSWNSNYIFVTFYKYGETAQATSPGNLNFI